MFILGISAFYHDSSACLIKNGDVLAAAQEERFTRVRHDANFPSNAIRFCLEHAGITSAEVEFVVFYEKPFLKFERLIETYLAFVPNGFNSFRSSMLVWLKEKLFQKRNLLKALDTCLGSSVNWSDRLLFTEHHLSHGASAFFPSPFESAAVLTLDGVGEWATTSLAHGSGRELKILKEICFPHSLGLLYSAFTYHSGFKVNSGEYKLMGLAPYGKPKYTELIKQELIDVKEDGSFQLNISYFDYCVGLTMTNKRFDKLFGEGPRDPETPINRLNMDLAASIQKVTEEVLVKLALNAAQETNEENLCLAGGVALNCVANGVLRREKIFKNIWVQPAAGDAGGALGAALAAWHIQEEKTREHPLGQDMMRGSFLGPCYDNDTIRNHLDKHSLIYHEVTEKELIEIVALELTKQKAIGWMQGRMEFGPRALGSRSIIADPRPPEMQRKLNLKIKHRESFRPFAPSILSEHVTDWFEDDEQNPYMLFVSKVLELRRINHEDNKDGIINFGEISIPRSVAPAITHVDYTSRLQTVHKETNPLYHALIERFYKLTGFPLVVNTSFNVRGEPIVCDPDDAIQCFMGTNLDVLAIGNFICIKEEQKIKSSIGYLNQYGND